MNFTRWSVLFPGSQRRAARGDRAARTPSTAAGSVPAARGERGTAGPGPEATAGSRPDLGEVPTLEELSAQALFTQVPAPVAVVYGPDHRIAYVNEAYAALFGTCTPGLPAREALPELQEMGLLPLMDQVLRSGTPRTVKSRRVPRGGLATPGAQDAEPAHASPRAPTQPTPRPDTPPTAPTGPTPTAATDDAPTTDGTPSRATGTSTRADGAPARTDGRPARAGAGAVRIGGTALLRSVLRGASGPPTPPVTSRPTAPPEPGTSAESDSRPPDSTPHTEASPGDAPADAATTETAPIAPTASAATGPAAASSAATAGDGSTTGEGSTTGFGSAPGRGPAVDGNPAPDDGSATDGDAAANRGSTTERRPDSSPSPTAAQAAAPAPATEPHRAPSTPHGSDPTPEAAHPRGATPALAPDVMRGGARRTGAPHTATTPAEPATASTTDSPATPAPAPASAPAQATDLTADPICEAVADPLADLAIEPPHHADPEPRAVPGARGGPERHTRGWHWPGAARLAPRVAPVAAPPAPRARDSYYTFTCTPIQVAPPLAAATSHPDTASAAATEATPTPHSAPHSASHAISEANPTTEADSVPAPAVTDSAPTDPRPADSAPGAPTNPSTNPPRAHNAAAPTAPDASRPSHDASQGGDAPRPTPPDAPLDDAPSPARLIIDTPSHPAPAAPATEAPLGTVPPAQQPTTFYRGVLVYAADVTDQVEAVERLRVSERRQREAAVTLQRSLLPQKLEQPDDLRVAATYQPGGTEAAVGGDWYDVITLGAGRTALVIGDVMGRGLRAAAVMGQLRTAVRAYARLDLPPHEVLQLLDGLAAEIDASQIATCVYAVHDPNEGRLIYASAGHLPILVRDPDGTVHRAAEPTGPPLGTGGWLHASGSVPLSPGSSAVLYTDGLVERRDRDIDEGVADLERAFAGAAGSPQVMCDRLIRSLGITADHDDDVAVLVLQHPARTGHDAELFHNAALELLGGVEAAPRARAFASGVLASWRFPTELRDLGVLATSELVANSLQHGTPPMRLRLRRTDRRLIIEVTDGDDHLPRRRRAEPADEAGRGISIIATIASSWGSRRTPDGGKAVWCEFALPRH
ncbi:hypothetical protein GCM10023324_39880 [Streptomyces youssoufiensis]